MMPVNKLQYFALIIEKDKVQHARYMKLEKLSVKKQMDSHCQQSSTDLRTSRHNLKHLFTKMLHLSDEMTKTNTEGHFKL